MSTLTRIPLPADLPAPWEQPEDEQRFWMLDRMHFPNPLTQLDDTMVRTIYSHGINHAAELYDLPMRAQARRFWTYHYVNMAPLPLPDEELEAMGKRSEEKLGQAMARLEELWTTQWLPDIKQHIEYWQQFDLQNVSMSTLLAHLNETIRRMQRLWAIHFEIVLPVMLPISLFDEFYRDLFGSDSAFAPYQLLQGFENKTVESGRELWRLSRKALGSPVVRAILEERSASEVIPALQASAEGQEFLADLRAYLNEYGHRGAIWGISYPTWIEDPTPAIKNLKDYVAQPDRDPEREQAAVNAERDRLIAEVRERLEAYPEAVRRQFEFLLKAAQTGNVLSEDHGFWIDFRAMSEIRRVFLEFGRRFADAGVIERPDDIFHLTVDEIRETAEYLPEIDRRRLVAERQAEIEHYRVMTPPPAVGTEPPGPPPDNPLTRTNAKFFGTPPLPSTDPNVLRGAAGSPGVVRGPAKVIHSLGEAVKLEPGDVLVAETTAPPWTPLFATAVAVVTDTGGILSHCAVVAREYQIPAVVGTSLATSVIQDGQLVEVDGDQGIVRLISSD